MLHTSKDLGTIIANDVCIIMHIAAMEHALSKYLGIPHKKQCLQVIAMPHTLSKGLGRQNTVGMHSKISIIGKILN